MKFWRIISIVGIVIAGLGITFHLQGQGMVGPDTSFMYSNPEWIGHGLSIAATGFVIVACGIALRLKKKD